VISLVPTQLQRLLGSRTATAWLRRFELILLGGGPVWPGLADAAARARLRISLSYGMTETAAMVAALRPDEFLAGERSCGLGLPHARLRIGRAGVVRVGGGSLFRGYAGGPRCRGDFGTGDLGAIDKRGRLSIIGRRDDVIITGGKKVHPGDVEAALRATGRLTDVVVVGVPDAEWGEMVVACCPAGQTGLMPPPALPELPAYQRPKRLLALKDWPCNDRGKVNRAGLRAAVSALLNPGR
jgi:O-succinylbenzoic acid--CoA ligase